MIKATCCLARSLAAPTRRRFFIAAAIISFRGIVHTFIVDFLRFVGLRRGVSLLFLFLTGFFFRFTIL